MPYQLTHAAWLARETERVKGILMQHLDPSQTYSIAEILAMLSHYGLDYSNPEYQEIGANLIADGTIEQV